MAKSGDVCKMGVPELPECVFGETAEGISLMTVTLNSSGQLSGGGRCRETGNGIRRNRPGIYGEISGPLWEGLNRT